jgi:hypothetical protein
MPLPAISYEVTVRLADAGDASEFETWMRQEHIPAVLATGLFTRAEFARMDDKRFRTHYLAATRAELDRYLEQYSPALRDEFARRFGSRASASREIWEPLQMWP